MVINTASAAVSFTKELEQNGVKFYEDISRRFPQGKDTFLAMAGDNRKYIVQVEIAYYSVISDAIEGCFAFTLNPEEFKFKPGFTEAMTYVEALGKAIEMEGKMVKFYSEAAAQSKSLLGDISRVFGLIVRKRNERIAALKLLS